MEQPEQIANEATEFEEVEEKALFTWEAPDLLEHTRGWKYFTGFGLFFIVLIAYFIYSKDWFAAVILIILPILIIIYQVIRKPELKTYTITQIGIYENDLFYPFNEIYSFWINTKHLPNTLNIIFSKKYLPQLTIQLKEIEPIEIRKTLSKYIPEESSKTESLIDKLARLLKI